MEDATCHGHGRGPISDFGFQPSAVMLGRNFCGHTIFLLMHVCHMCSERCSTDHSGGCSVLSFWPFPVCCEGMHMVPKRPLFNPPPLWMREGGVKTVGDRALFGAKVIGVR